MVATLSPARRFLKFFHCEAIPGPGATLYNWLSSTGVFRRHYELAARHIVSRCSDGCLLDIGTGPGWLLLKLHQKSAGMRLVGLDVSAAMVATARRNVADAGLADVIEIRQGNADDLPFADNSFDAVVSTGSIHHWKDPTTGLNEVYRVLKPGGDALMYDIVSDTPKSVVIQAKHDFGRLNIALFWLHSFEEPFYSRENFEALSRPTLFKECRSQFVGLFCCLMLKKEARD